MVSESGWFAARPSGTENLYKLYAESLKSAEHLYAIVEQAQQTFFAPSAGSESVLATGKHSARACPEGGATELSPARDRECICPEGDRMTVPPDSSHSLIEGLSL